MTDEYMSYIATKECGCLTMAAVDSPENKKVVAREVAKAIRMGEKVERVTCEHVRTMEWKCPQHKNPLAHPGSETKDKHSAEQGSLI
jgi:hypothetical protein